jgi:hypothetical protein
MFVWWRGVLPWVLLPAYSCLSAGQTDVITLPQAHPGVVYAAQLYVPAGLSYPFSCNLTGLPKGLNFDCAHLQITGKAPSEGGTSYNLILILTDTSGKPQTYSLILQVSSKPEMVSLAVPAADSAGSTNGDQKTQQAVATTKSDSTASAPLTLTPPRITPNPVPGSTLSGSGEPQDATKFPTVKIYVCSAVQKPISLDCGAPGTPVIPPADPNPASATYVQTDTKGAFQSKLKSPLAANSYVWVTEVGTPSGAGAKDVTQPQAEAVAVITITPVKITNVTRVNNTWVNVTGIAQPESTPEANARPVSLCVLNPQEGYGYASANQAVTCGSPNAVTADVGPTGVFQTMLDLPVYSGDYIAATQIVTPDGGSSQSNSIVPMQPSTYDGVCQYPFNDCDFDFSLVGGIEQSDLSAESSTTTGFIFLFVRAPLNMRWGDVWLRSSFLGAPSATATNNIVAAATNPSGAITASSLPQSVNSVDYAIGAEHNFWLPDQIAPDGGQFTLGSIAFFGATTPLSSNTLVSGVAVPPYGTNECNQLQLRFTTKQGYNPPLPSSGFYVPSTSSTPTMGCVVQPPGGSTTTSAANPGMEISTIAFSNQDRSSFLLKYGAGIRLIRRSHAAGTDICSNAGSGTPKPGLCTRSVVDITIGQDEAITGGYLRRFVLKGDAILPIMQTGVYFFGTSATRIARNVSYSPLILSPVTVTTGPSSSSGSSMTVPSSSVFVLPYKHQNRDFYSIGIGLDAKKILTKLFNPSAK